MRIVGGTYRGKKLHSPKSDTVRPTSDQARESIFNILNSQGLQWEKTDFLDIYAGTGAFGLEAISRGAKSVTMIDLDITTAQKNSALFAQEQNKIKLIRANATNLPIPPQQYDIVFMDAPYNQGLSEITLNSLFQNKYLKKDTVIIVELHKNENLAIPPVFTQTSERTYGIAKFVFFTLA